MFNPQCQLQTRCRSCNLVSTRGFMNMYNVNKFLSWNSNLVSERDCISRYLVWPPEQVIIYYNFSYYNNFMVWRLIWLGTDCNLLLIKGSKPVYWISFEYSICKLLSIKVRKIQLLKTIGFLNTSGFSTLNQRPIISIISHVNWLLWTLKGRLPRTNQWQVKECATTDLTIHSI